MSMLERLVKVLPHCGHGCRARVFRIEEREDEGGGRRGASILWRGLRWKEEKGGAVYIGAQVKKNWVRVWKSEMAARRNEMKRRHEGGTGWICSVRAGRVGIKQGEEGEVKLWVGCVRAVLYSTECMGGGGVG